MLLAGSAGLLNASEGTAEIRNLVGGQARCWASSVLMRDFNYKILLSCRDLVYPINSETFTYTLWVTEQGSGDPIRLGDVGIGKREFDIEDAFNGYFVTEERTSNPRNPSDRVIMAGQVQPIAILEGPTPTAGPQATAEPNSGFGQVNQSPLPTDGQESTTSSAFSALKIVGGVIVVAVLMVIVIALVSASRRRPIDL